MDNAIASSQSIEFPKHLHVSGGEASFQNPGKAANPVGALLQEEHRSKPLLRGPEPNLDQHNNISIVRGAVLSGCNWAY